MSQTQTLVRGCTAALNSLQVTWQHHVSHTLALPSRQHGVFGSMTWSQAGRSLSSSAEPGLPPVMPPPDADRNGTADLADVFMPEPVDQTCERKVNAVTPGLFKDYGGRLRFAGQVSTVRCFENNPLVRKAVGEPGKGRVLVVDGGASMRCALLGDQLAATAVKNGWSGIIVNGCIRDSEDIGGMQLGVKALATHPLKSSKRDPGLRDVPVTFGGVTFKPGDWVYADKDGILVSSEQLKLSK